MHFVVPSGFLFCGRVLSGMVLVNYLIEQGDVVENEDNAGNDDEMMTTMKEINVDFCGSNYVKTTLITDSLHW